MRRLWCCLYALAAPSQYLHVLTFITQILTGHPSTLACLCASSAAVTTAISAPVRLSRLAPRTDTNSAFPDISKVRSVNLDTWTADQLAVMESVGNANARLIYEATLPANYPRPTAFTGTGYASPITRRASLRSVPCLVSYWRGFVTSMSMDASRQSPPPPSRLPRRRHLR